MIEYDKDAIVYPYITEYLRKEIPPHKGILKELEEYAEKNSVPIVQPETAQLLEVLAAIKRPERILEVGCAIGYSAILTAQYLAPGGTVTTLEWDADMAEIARENIKKAGLESAINVIHNDAKEVIPTLTAEYDIIFLDHMMPQMDGVECFNIMKEMEDNKCKDTPVIVLTANAVSGAKEEYLRIGFNDFLSKPIIPDKLEEMIRNNLKPELVNLSK